MPGISLIAGDMTERKKKIYFMTSWSLHSTDTAMETSNHISVYSLLMEEVDGTKFFHDILLNTKGRPWDGMTSFGEKCFTA